MNNIHKNGLILLACALCAGLAKAQVTGTPYIANGCPTPAAPGTMTLTPAAPVLNLNGTFTATVPNVAGMTYTWTLPAGLTGSSPTNSITITGATTSTYDASAITVTATNSCGATSAARAGTGTANICVGAALRNNIPASVTLGGYTWSTKNVDAPGTFTAHAGDRGMFYQWDRKIGWSSSNPMTSIPAGQTWSSASPTSPNTVWDLTNNNPCPTGWTVPSYFPACNNLVNLGSVWIDACTAANLGLGTIAGRIYNTTTVPASYSAYNVNTMLFFPASGMRNRAGTLLGANMVEGSYWSTNGVQNGDASSGTMLDFSATYSMTANTNMAYAINVRCVQ